MILILRIAVIIIGVFFLLPGFAGVFRPERLADALMLAPEAAEGWVAIRVLIGAPYIAIGLVTLYAAVRGRWAWLVPVAAIEGVMTATRTLSGILDGFEAAGVHLIAVELTICIVLSLAAGLLARSQT